MTQQHYLPATLAALLLTVCPVQSQATAFTDKTAFLTALPGPAGVLDFDSLSGGSSLSNTTQTVTGGPGTGIIFPGPFSLDGDTLNWQVVANTGDNPTTSGSNSFGTSDTGNYNTIVAGTGGSASD